MKSDTRLSDSKAVDRSGTAGSRGETSVLFSLGALMARADTAPGGQASDAAKDDESGLIDIRALARQRAPSEAVRGDDSGLIDIKELAARGASDGTARSASADASPVTTHLALFPFDVPAPAESPATQAPDGAKAAAMAPIRAASRAPIIAGGLIALAGIAVAAIIVARGPAEQPARAAGPVVTSAAREALAATAAADRARADDASRAPAQEGSPLTNTRGTTPNEGSAPPVGRIARRPGTNTGGESDTHAKEKPGPTPPTTRGPDPCNGNLMCAMERAAKNKPR